MATVQLLGRGTYGPQVPMGRGVSRLWTYFLGVPAQNSILIYDNGDVVEQAGFDNDQIEAPNVYMFILGGTRFRCQTDSFEYNALTDAGYTWEEIPEYNVYTATYTSQYP